MGWGGGRAVGKCTGGGAPCPEPFLRGLTGSATGATCVKVEHTPRGLGLSGFTLGRVLETGLWCQDVSYRVKWIQAGQPLASDSGLLAPGPYPIPPGSWPRT